MTSKSIAVIGAGITGVTTAYELANRGYAVTVYDRNRYPAMETSFANGGQLSASNAEVWNHISTIRKGLGWMLSPEAPLSLSLAPNWHKYSWLAEFIGHIPHYRKHTTETARLAVAARGRMREIGEKEGIDFNREDRGILHFYTTQKQMDHARRVSALLAEGGVVREELDADGVKRAEPTLTGDFVGGYFTPGDSSGDIHLFTTGLAQACARLGVTFQMEADVIGCETGRRGGVAVTYGHAADTHRKTVQRTEHAAVVVCAGVRSRALAHGLGDRVNVYPVKGYSITVNLQDEASRDAAPMVSLLDDEAKIVSSRLGSDRFRIAGTAEFAGENRDIRAKRIAPLVHWVNRFFPGVCTRQSVPWAGLRPMMPSMMPKVGPGRREGVFYNTGHGHLGWTLAAATSEAVAAAVSSRI